MWKFSVVIKLKHSLSWLEKKSVEWQYLVEISLAHEKINTDPKNSRQGNEKNTQEFQLSK